MKKLLPYLFPLLALLIVIWLGYRWYNNKSARPEDKIPEFAEGVKIDDLSNKEMTDLLNKGAKDLNSVELKSSSASATAVPEMGKGEIRYDIQENKVSFTVSADLPAPKEGKYQVWLREPGTEARKKAFVLEVGKSGYLGSGSISAETLPFEVVVSLEKQDDSTLETVLMTGTVTQPTK